MARVRGSWSLDLRGVPGYRQRQDANLYGYCPNPVEASLLGSRITKRAKTKAILYRLFTARSWNW